MKSLFVLLCIGFLNSGLVIGPGCEKITLDDCRAGSLCTKRESEGLSVQECKEYCHQVNDFELSGISIDKTCFGS